MAFLPQNPFMRSTYQDAPQAHALRSAHNACLLVSTKEHFLNRWLAVLEEKVYMKNERQEKSRNSPRILTPLFVCIVTLNLFLSVASQSLISGIPLQMLVLGQTNFHGGMLITIYIVSVIIARTVSGGLIDRFSRARIIHVGALLLLSGSCIALVDPSVQLQICSRILQGFGFASVHTAVNSAAADVLPRERLGEGLAYATLGPALAMALGPSLALFLTSFEYSSTYFIGITLIASLVFLIGFTVRYEKHPQRLEPTSGYRIARNLEQQRQNSSDEPSAFITTAKPSSSPLEQGFEQNYADTQRSVLFSLLHRLFEKAALKGSLPMMFIAMGMSVFFSLTPTFARVAGYEHPGIFFIVAAAVAILIRVFSSRIFDAGYSAPLLVIAIGSSVVALLGILLIKHEFVFYLMGIGYGTGFGIMVPLLNSVAIKASPPRRYGPANALFFLLYDFGLGIGALLWGLLLDVAGYSPVFLGGTICFIAALFVGLPALSGKARSKAEQLL